MGKETFQPTEKEKSSQVFRRSIFVVKNICRGEELSPKNIRIIRPAHGLHPRHFDEMMGLKAKHDIEMGTPLSWELVHTDT